MEAFVQIVDTKQLVRKMEKKNNIFNAIIGVALLVAIVIAIGAFLFWYISEQQHHMEIADYLRDKVDAFPEDTSSEYIQGWLDCVSAFEERYVVNATNVTDT